MIKLNYQSNRPYPNPQVEKENIEYAKLLLEDYAGTISEDTAIHLYIYQSLIIESKSPYLANILHRIAIVEMKHLKLLGETIHLLGLRPKYVTYSEDNIKQFWNSSSVNYTTSILNILKQNIKAETTAIDNYKNHLNQIQDKYIQNLLNRIIEDEQIHLSIFKQLYENQKKLELG